jgi:HTH-type transcriptional regulator/antitoxin HigA
MSALAPLPFDEQGYRELLSESLPRVIHNEAENDLYIERLEALHHKGRPLTAEEEELAELLALLIKDFEDKHYQLDPASPIEVVRELMEANDLKQVDLIDVFGTASIVSEVLSGKRELSRTHIKKLSQRFHVSPELFFPRVQ